MIELLNNQKRRQANAADVEAILPTAFERGHRYFAEFWDALTAAQKELLAALVQGEQITPELAAAAPVLLRKEILAPENGGHAFRVPLIGQWIAAKYNHEQNADE